MIKLKIGMLLGCLIGMMVLVYGTAILLDLLFGGYMLAGGLANLNYGVLALLCAAPFGLFAWIGTSENSADRGILMSGSLFSVLFILVHSVMVLSAEAMQNEAVARTLTIFPLSAFLIAAAVFIALKNERSV